MKIKFVSNGANVDKAQISQKLNEKIEMLCSDLLEFTSQICNDQNSIKMLFQEVYETL